MKHEPQTDEEDELYGVMARSDLHVRRQLAQLLSPKRWVRQSVVWSLSAVHKSSLVAVVHAVVRRFDESLGVAALALVKAKREAHAAVELVRKQASLPGMAKQAEEEEFWAEQELIRLQEAADLNSKEEAEAQASARRTRIEQQSLQCELTGLMRRLAGHTGMPEAFDTCPELLNSVATFIRRMGELIFVPFTRLMKFGKPMRTDLQMSGSGCLLELVDPDGLLNWCLDFLGLIAAFSDAICRRRERHHPPELAACMAGASEDEWPLKERSVIAS